MIRTTNNTAGIARPAVATGRHPVRTGAAGAARLRFAVRIAAAGFATSATAQGNDEQAGYIALISTPVGALTPLPPAYGAESRRPATKMLFQGRWGRLSPDEGLSNNTLGVGVEVPKGRWTLGGTLGYLSVSCTEDWEEFSDCESDIMLGGSMRRTLVRRPLAPHARSSTAGETAARADRTFVIGIEGATGFSPRQGANALALAASFPSGFVMEQDNLRVIPFLTPGIGYGRLGDTKFSEDDPSTSYGSALLLLGGGVGFEFPRSGFGATVGFQKVMRSGGGGTALGLTMNWSGSSARR